MALKIHRSDHPEPLVDALCDVIIPPQADPFAPEIVAVPTRGVDRWLTERIGATFARRGVGDGVAANIDFPLTHRFVRDVLARIPATAASIERRSGAALTARIGSLIDRHVDDPRLAVVARFVTGDDGEIIGAQRLRAARKIAALFAAYERHRPAMPAAWSRGDDVGPDGEPIDAPARWQPHLWRLLDADVDAPALSRTLPAAVEAIRSGNVPDDMPERLSLYGVTAVDPADLAVLAAIAATRDVHLFVLHPSPALWNSVAPVVDRPGPAIPILRGDDPTGEAAVHPLLRSWARESRELQITLAAVDADHTDVRPSPEPSSQTLLTTIQQDVRHNRTPTTGVPVGEGDRSIQIHACHGARRQVEVLRDALLHVMADDPTIEPRDVVIMTPDLETFAPLIDAAFPAVPGDGPQIPDLRVRIADRAPAHTNPLVRLAGTVLDLAGSRLEASVVVEFSKLPDVRRRFSIDDDTAALLDALVDDANVRWGLDGEHRRRGGAGPRDDHTWVRAVDRILTGVFFADRPDRIVADVAPLTGIEGEHAVAAGRLAHLVDRIAAVVELLNRTRPLPEWADAVSTAVRLLAVPARGDEWQWDQLERLLAETFDPAGDGTVAPDTDLAEASLLVAPWTDGRPGALHHRTGDVTVCSLVPMRSVPYRVVALLGLDDERFPRSGHSDGDDLLADAETVGDPDRGAEDRQLLLDAFMAAGDHLLVTYSGHDALTNAAYPPAVPVAELIDLVTDMAGPAAADRIVTRHLLQPFNPGNFIAGELIPGEPWSFDPMQRSGAAAVRGRSTETIIQELSIPEDTEPVSHLRLDDLVTFLQHPAKAFLRGRLGVTIPDLDDRADDTLPTELAPLEKWAVTDRILSGLAAGKRIETLVARERAADAVPAGELAEPDLDSAVETAERLWAVAAGLGYDPAAVETVSGTIDVDGVTIDGSVPAAPASARIDLVTPSRLRGKQRLAAYTRLVFLSAVDPDRAWTATVVGKDRRGGSLRVVTMGPVGTTGTERADAARRRLATLLRLYRDGTAAPIPLFCETSYAWAATDERWREREASGKWMPGWNSYDPERDQPAHRLLFPTLDTFEAVLATDFAAVAGDLWRPILRVTKETTA